MKVIGTIDITAEVPETFPGHAKRLGYSPEELLFMLADDLCVRAPRKIERQVAAPAPANVIAFPRQEGAA